MKKYIPKQHGCPYRTSDGKCVHKGSNPWKTKRKKLCGYKQPENCDLYNEWVEQRKAIVTPLKSKLEVSGD
jgi:hypothetical protein